MDRHSILESLKTWLFANRVTRSTIPISAVLTKIDQLEDEYE